MERKVLGTNLPSITLFKVLQVALVLVFLTLSFAFLGCWVPEGDAASVWEGFLQFIAQCLCGHSLSLSPAGEMY